MLDEAENSKPSSKWVAKLLAEKPNPTTKIYFVSSIIADRK
jgi:hypothetical protein